MHMQAVVRRRKAAARPPVLCTVNIGLAMLDTDTHGERLALNNQPLLKKCKDGITG